MESETHGNRDSETRGAPIDFGAVLLSVARYWKLIAATTAFTLAASYGVLRFVPSPYKSTVEILVYDPQRQIDSAIQKPISPFLDPMGYDAMNTEIGILKSKSVALRVAGELHLDEDPEFQGGSGLAEILHRAGVKEVLDRIDLPRWIKPSHPAGPDSALPTKAEKLDQAAEILAGRIQAWAESYIISISVTAQSPAMAARVTTAIAETYLRSQRDARQQALEQVADWLKSRVDGLRSRIVEAETEITKLSAENDIMDTDTSNVREKQIAALNSQLMAAREQVAERGAHLAQARRVVDSNGDLQSISELTASGTLSKLRQEETQLNLRVQDLTNRVGPRHSQVVAARTALAVVRQQISAEGEHILGNMQNAYDIAVQQQQSIMLALRALTTHVNPEALRALRNLRRTVEADRILHENYLSQYNEMFERRTLLNASARIISPASLPKAPSSSRKKMIYAAAAALGLGCGVVIALLRELLRPGIKTCVDAERSFGLPVMGVIPALTDGKVRKISHDRLVDMIIKEPFSDLGRAVQTLRVCLELSSAGSKVVLVTSAIAAEGKSTTAMLLGASSVASGKKTVLLDCDLHRQVLSGELSRGSRPTLSELLQGTATIAEVLTIDPMTKAYLIPAGAGQSNPADLLMSKQMGDLIAVLRRDFDYIIIDAPPLLPVIDALVLSTVVDKVLMVVEWSNTPRASISEAFKVLRSEVDRVAGIVLNKVDLDRLPEHRYGGYRGSYRYRDNYRPDPGA